MISNKIITNKDHLETPRFLTEALGPFDLDPCAGPETFHAETNYKRGGLKSNWDLKPWTTLVWLNPPFSEKGAWWEKAIAEYEINGVNIILVLPARTPSPHFAEYAGACGGFFLIGHKINFVGGEQGNNLGSVLFPLGNLAKDRVKNNGLPGIWCENPQVTLRENALIMWKGNPSRPI